MRPSGFSALVCWPLEHMHPTVRGCVGPMSWGPRPLPCAGRAGLGVGGALRLPLGSPLQAHPGVAGALTIHLWPSQLAAGRRAPTSGRLLCWPSSLQPPPGATSEHRPSCVLPRLWAQGHWTDPLSPSTSPLWFSGCSVKPSVQVGAWESGTWGLASEGPISPGPPSLGAHKYQHLQGHSWARFPHPSCAVTVDPCPTGSDHAPCPHRLPTASRALGRAWLCACPAQLQLPQAHLAQHPPPHGSPLLCS